MDFSPVLADLKADKLAARRFEREGHSKFRDCVTVAKNGRVVFQRYSWGEAASLAFEMFGRAGQDGVIEWEKPRGSYDASADAPKRLTGYDAGALLFDDGTKRWPAAAGYRHWRAKRGI